MPDPTANLIACPDCDLLQRDTQVEPGGVLRCRRCGAVLYRRTIASVDRTLALCLTAMLLFALANLFPLVELKAQGQSTATTLFQAVRRLYDDRGMFSVAGLVFLTTMLLPALELALMLYILAPLRLGRAPGHLRLALRLAELVRPWGMVEVFMLGVLVSLAKLAHLATVVPGVALWSFAALIPVMAGVAAVFNPREIWAFVPWYSAQARP